MLMPAARADGLPELGDVSATVLSPLQEQKIAEQIMRDAYASGDVVTDVEITDYVRGLGQQLAVSSPNQRQPFYFFVVKDNSINAFAMPGGVIGVHTGLIVASKSESEVASVLGHEIGHVVQRHLARMLAQQKQDSILTLATMGLALLASRANPDLASGAMTAASAGAIQKQLDYTREHEREADRVGLQILNNAGFDPRAMPAFFETLQRGTRFVDGSAPSFLRTHPLTVERISDVRGRVEQLPKRDVPDSQEYHYVRAKLMAAIGTARQAISVFEDSIEQKQYANEAAQHYGLARAHMRNHDLASAEVQLDWLHKNAAQHPMVATLAADIAVARNDPATAAKLYAAGLSRFPSYRALIYGYAEHYIATRQYDKALQLIDDKQSLYPDDAYFYELKSQVYTAQGKNLLRHQAQGEAYYRRYNYQGALEQMDLAVKAGDGDFYQRSIVEARLNQLRQRIDEPSS
jgi:predicted Zn-dependent protease